MSKTQTLESLWTGFIILFFSFAGVVVAAPSDGVPLAGALHGYTRINGAPISEVEVSARNAADNSSTKVVSGADGAFLLQGLKPGHYEISAKKEGFESPSVAALDLTAGQDLPVDLALRSVAAVQAKPPEGFLRRFIGAYVADWHPSPLNANTPPPAFRGDPPVEDNPPYPFTTWPMGGTVVIGQPNMSPYPLTTALQEGPNGDWWKKSGIQMYGWVNVGMNISSSHDGPYANAPAAYNQIANSIQLDQATLYIERDPDTVQTDHFDWGFRFTSLYGFDYRFTTQQGIFSNQLLQTKANGSIGNKYGFDPVMAYVDLYFPHVAQGLDVRIGRYISLPDIEAQLAPNNYTYTHSLVYTYDCYTQDGINGTFKLSDHWTVQAGFSGSCDTAPWTGHAKPTVNLCAAYTWGKATHEIYACANSINDSEYSYNNLAAYYLTYYWKINSKWHADFESWYQYEKHTPNIFNPAAQSLIQTNANGAWCDHVTELTCFAPEWSVLNYVNRQMGKKDFISIRDEYFDDLKGQRTGYKTPYVEAGISWNHWIGSTLVFRPEIRYEHAFSQPAYDSGNKKTQVMFAGDLIFFF